MMGMMTPAVSHVGAEPAAGSSVKTQRRHGVTPGLTVKVTP